LKDMGLIPQLGRHLFERDAYLAGSDDARLEDLLWALESPDIKAVFFARGGYGSMRIAARLSDKRFPPKLVMGFSDNCAILFALTKKAAVVHGPHICSPSFQRPSRLLLSWLRKVLMGAEPPGEFPSKLAVLKPGEAEGLSLVANLSMLVSSLATPLEPNLAGRVLILEETNEPPYRIDRMLTQLRLSGRLARVRAIVFGNMGVPRRSLECALQPLLEEFRGPVLWGARVGHIRDNLPFPVGVKTAVTTQPARIKISGLAAL